MSHTPPFSLAGEFERLAAQLDGPDLRRLQEATEWGGVYHGIRLLASEHPAPGPSPWQLYQELRLRT